MRLALWPDSDAVQALREIEEFFAGQRAPTPQAAFVGVRPDSTLCGLVEVSIHTAAPGCATDRIGYLEAWYVDPEMRRRGLGRALVASAESWAIAQGCREMASDTTSDYPLSPDAHAALGYAEVGCTVRLTTPAHSRTSCPYHHHAFETHLRRKP